MAGNPGVPLGRSSRKSQSSAQPRDRIGPPKKVVCRDFASWPTWWGKLSAGLARQRNPKVHMMSQAAEIELLQRVWDYPLFAALYGRRSRRFGLGFEIAEGPFRYRSRHAALPLDEFEEALLLAAGTGASGIPLWDGSRPPAVRRRDGRTFGSTAHGRDTALFFTNDRGFHVIEPADVTACNRS